jgi:hypothetical protein
LTFILCLHRIFWYSKQFEGKTSEKEPWYGTDYIIERIDKKLLEVQIFLLASSLHLYSFQGLSSSCCSNKQGFYSAGSAPVMEFGTVERISLLELQLDSSLWKMSCVQCRNVVSKRSLEIVELES